MPVAPPRYGGELPKHPVVRRLIELRVLAGMSRDELSKRIGCSTNDLLRYERNGVQPRAWTFLAWCEALGVTLNWPCAEDKE